MLSKILIAEDEDNIRKLIASYLVNDGFEIIEASDGEEAIKKFDENNNLSLVILDVMMPKLDGYSVCNYIRKESKDVPILMLTARNSEYDELEGFNAGADEYISKPFSPRILVTRVKNLLKRTSQNIQDISFEKIIIKYRERTVLINNEKIILTPKEFDLLYFLLQNKNIVLTRNQILSKVWGWDYIGYDRTVDTHIKCLRSKIGEYGKNIITIRKVGYKFDDII